MNENKDNVRPAEVLAIAEAMPQAIERFSGKASEAQLEEFVSSIGMSKREILQAADDSMRKSPILGGLIDGMLLGSAFAAVGSVIHMSRSSKVPLLKSLKVGATSFGPWGFAIGLIGGSAMDIRANRTLDALKQDMSSYMDRVSAKHPKDAQKSR